MFRVLVRGQQWLSARFDALLPGKYVVDGNQDFLESFVPKYLQKNVTVYDIGGGKNPYLDPEMKSALQVTVHGLDIDERELAAAPKGAYDRTIVADLTEFRGDNDSDLVICQALLEHVKDTAKAFAAISSILKPGGLALVFVPSRNAIYSRINLLLPETLRRKILYMLYPDGEKNRGFTAYYDRCTPLDFRRLAERNGLSVVEERHYFVSKYFSFFFPAYVLWRAWVLVFHLLAREWAPETFSMCLRKSG